MTHGGTAAGDDALMRQVQAGDTAAFDRLYDRFSGPAYSVARRVSRDPTRAEDIVQETFLSVWRGCAAFRSSRGPLAAWIMGIARNRALDSRRRDLRHDLRNAGDSHIDRPARVEHALDDDVIERDEAARLRTVLATLPPAQRDVITLAYFGQLSASEIAAELELPLGTVKGRMRLGLRKLSDRVQA